MKDIVSKNPFLKDKTTTLAEELTGSRVYSTDLHPHNFSDLSAVQVEEALVRADISLKAKIITRGLVTINGAHFMSPTGMRFIETKKEDFLENPAMRTAYRIDESVGFGAYQREYQNESFDMYREFSVDDASIASHARFLDEKLQRILPWNPEGVGGKLQKSS